jgi:hypothetical protein
MATENGNATKADLKGLETRVQADLRALEARIEGRMDAQEQRIIEHVGTLIHESETRLLQAFYGFAEAFQSG